MKKTILTTLMASIWLLSMQAQRFEIGVTGGGTKYIGDIGNEYYFIPNEIGYGGVFKMNHNPWYSYRLGFIYTPIKANDAYALSQGRQQRKFSFDGTVYELSLGIEYNFIKNNIYKRHKGNHIIPYMFSGITGTKYSSQLVKGGSIVSASNNYSVGIPMVLGIKFYVSGNFLIAIESGARFNLTDNLDGTFNYVKANQDQHYFSKVNSNMQHPDWYTFSSISLIYTFGDLDCYFGL